MQTEQFIASPTENMFWQWKKIEKFDSI